MLFDEHQKALVVPYNSQKLISIFMLADYTEE